MDAPDYPPPPAARPRGRGFTIAGFVMAAIALLFLPPIFGALAVAFGVIGMRQGDALGKKAIIAGIVGMVIGLLLAALIVAGNDDDDALRLLTSLT